MSSCNVNCQFYVWNGKTKPDSEKMVKTLVPSLQAKERKPCCPICGKSGWCSCGYGPEHNHEPEP
jgi:hypothetical protein